LQQLNNGTRSLNRMMMNVFWIILCIAMFAELAGIIKGAINGADKQLILQDTIDYVMKPTLWMLFIAGLGEWLLRRKGAVSDYAILIVSELLPVIIILYYHFLSGIQFTLLLGIMISALYYQWLKVVLALCSSLITFVILVMFFEPFSRNLDVNELIFSVTMFISFAFLAIAMMNRGLSLQKNLEQSKAEHERLFVDYITKDRIAKMDGLTQVYNRKAFDELIGVLEERDFPFSMAFMDIDNFKSINDTYGHVVGDKVLQELAACASNVLPSDDFICRYGGEEFAILFFESDFEKVQQCAEEIRRQIEELVLTELDGRRITASIGIAERRPGQSLADLKEQADNLLYRAKHGGKNKVIAVQSGIESEDLYQI